MTPDPDRGTETAGLGWRATAPVLAVLAVLAVAAVILALVVVARPSRGPVASIRLAAGARVSTSGTARERTVAMADRLLGLLPVAPGTEQVSDGAPYGLSGPPSTPVSPDLVDQGRVWAGTGTVSAAEAYVEGHLPPGFRTTGTGSGTDGTGPTVSYVDHTPGRRWQQPGVYAELTVLISYTETGDQVGVRADVQAIWLPSRVPSQHIPRDAAGVTIDYVPHLDTTRTHQRHAHVDRGAAVARRLARAVDGLPVAPPGTSSCPAAFDDQTVMVFHGGGPDRRVVYQLSGCRGVRVGRRGPGLDTDAAFAAAYRDAIRHR